MLVKAVTIQGLTYEQIAARFGVPKSPLHKLHHRWFSVGDASFEPRSRRPK
jgi:transposase